MDSPLLARDVRPRGVAAVTLRDIAHVAGSLAAVGAVTAAYTRWLDVTNATTVALSFVFVVLLVASTGRLWVAVLTSVAAMVCINYFFLPPVGTFSIADPRNWVALAAFLAVSLVASHLSAIARARTDEALARRDELARLFGLSRDILLMTDTGDGIVPLPKLIARRFALDYVAICLPDPHGGWRVAEGGALMLALDRSGLAGAMAAEDGPRSVSSDGHTIRLIPLRFGARSVGVLAVAGRPLEAATLDALGGIAAIAVERTQFLEEREAADLSRRSEELKSALLASLAHDLRTPLTAIRVAATNLQASWPDAEQRREQTALVLSEVGRLTRLFQNILEMARIDAGAIETNPRVVHPSEIVEAARDQVGDALDRHTFTADVQSDRLVRVDPRLTASALAHVLENAAKYTPPGSRIAARARVTADGLVISVRDGGDGIAAADLPHIFERFYRGTQMQSRTSGTGMGLSIAKGLLAAERGRLSVENIPGAGAEFTISVPAETRAAASLATVEQAS